METKDRTMITSFAAAASLIVALASGHAGADNGCQSLEKASCTQSKNCRWVKGYKRSDGRSIAAYCRKLPGSRKSAEKESGMKVNKG